MRAVSGDHGRSLIVASADSFASAIQPPFCVKVDRFRGEMTDVRELQSTFLMPMVTRPGLIAS